MLRLVRYILGIGGSGSDAIGASGQDYPALFLNFLNNTYEVNLPYSLDVNFITQTYSVGD
jgi:hypothetical protein